MRRFRPHLLRLLHRGQERRSSRASPRQLPDPHTLAQTMAVLKSVSLSVWLPVLIDQSHLVLHGRDSAQCWLQIAPFQFRVIALLISCAHVVVSRYVRYASGTCTLFTGLDSRVCDRRPLKGFVALCSCIVGCNGHLWLCLEDGAGVKQRHLFSMCSLHQPKRNCKHGALTCTWPGERA